MNENKPVFLDTNIWLYAFLKITDINKAEISHSLINRQGVVVSTQVINEVCVNLIKKSSFNESKIKQLIQDFYQGCRVIQFNHKILLLASDLFIN
jgi:predicted nucleic acid-binding protein